MYALGSSSAITHLKLQSRLGGNPLKFQVNCPPNYRKKTALLKRVKDVPSARKNISARKMSQQSTPTYIALATTCPTKPKTVSEHENTTWTTGSRRYIARRPPTRPPPPAFAPNFSTTHLLNVVLMGVCFGEDLGVRASGR